VHRLLAAVLAATSLSIAPVAAADVSGQQLLALCTANMGGTGNALEAAECMGYVVGVADTFDCVEAEHGLRWNSSASPSQPELVRLVVDYISSHPTELTSVGHMSVARALSDAMPCPSNAGAEGAGDAG